MKNHRSCINVRYLPRLSFTILILIPKPSRYSGKGMTMTYLWSVLTMRSGFPNKNQGVLDTVEMYFFGICKTSPITIPKVAEFRFSYRTHTNGNVYPASTRRTSSTPAKELKGIAVTMGIFLTDSMHSLSSGTRYEYGRTQPHNVLNFSRSTQ